ITCSLKTHTASHFYSLILQSLSVRDHRTALIQICSQREAVHTVSRLSPVMKDIIPIVVSAEHWILTDQLICITKPLVDVIGDIESQDATLADCMLPEFAAHTQLTLNREFHAINTDIYWLGLFLHPLCQKLAIFSAAHLCKLVDTIRILLDIML
ncbi:hypothetical protein POSPLADRAFT_1160181, partial [Postia placenta MAD-698-R-SB12]